MAVVLCLLCTCISCGISDDPTAVIPKPEPEPTPEEKVIDITEEGSSKMIMSGYQDNITEGGVLKPEGWGTSIYIKDKKLYGASCTFVLCNSVKRLDAMPESSTMTGWREQGIITEEGACWVRHTTNTKYSYLKLRIAYIDANKVGVEYKVTSEEEITNFNANPAIEGKTYISDYSIPHLNPENYYVEHTATYDNQTILNYALEWDASKKHSAWVAFSFDKVTSANTVKRTDAWNVDPYLPSVMQTTESMHKSDGFDKGHLVASYDRVYSKEANEQTFYYSNMSPQLNSFNGGFWASFEGLVQRWARSNKYDKLYVAKGGTLSQLLVNFTGEKAGADGVQPQTDANGFTKHGLACPKYYFMAILAYKGGDVSAENSYQAIGFWMEHRDDYGYKYDNFAPSSVMKQYALSIDELEQKTDIDFFCNLPDNLEKWVEKAYNEDDWAW